MSYKSINFNKDILKLDKGQKQKFLKGQEVSQGPKPISEREVLIRKEIRQKGSVTVKDIAASLKGISEKTIQRELVALMGKGVLKREGERRWSRYLLA